MKLLTLDIIVCNEIKYMIENTPLLEGEKLPSERELAEKFEVQRGTVRTGLKLLLQEGWICAKERSGYFVAPRRIEKNVYRISSTSQTVAEMGKKQRLKLLSISRKEVGKELSIKLKLPIGTKYYAIERIRYVDDEKISLEASAVPYDVAPDLDKKDLENNSLYDVLEDDYLNNIAFSEQEIIVVESDEYTAKALSIPVGQKLVKQQGLVMSKEKEPIEYIEAYMLMDRFVFVNNDLLPKKGRN
ncbi:MULTISPECIES: GntR family transcriptional regulator [Breznakia]|uniref:GntR family transcriptional regulator n=1 Tax=Breznakia blatticola TaxID=1754012 RepID=A0A4R7ZIX1_9FIRM|nr:MULTISPECIES: GntR family transcriptional regulator [Breznakia]MDH6367942.1 DNA-binding GntR family transcriptional regulator [Breznakia sp. PH1-1]MDH6405030.1 DNA-binding GntR family transcriptional regulator [Breznakia sp. PF1-11]MDH6412745.1 DNA-binding GntR family transcriptional regulator [Breznakia sp. PFB1-11]MDH6415118.1 DNA-binding GntR family transcriptional regulator [Breznakia sp. PFB1-14]MDH6417416.1 DNA-binding GntR family transcriptional regulator [Breznakia sp. PFB1-4]